MSVESPQKKSKIDDVNVDEDLRSRDIAAVGREAVQKMAATRVLIAGMSGLGAEIAKGVMLAGVKSLTIQDTQATSYSDLSAQFYLGESDIGKNRAAACADLLTQLNPAVELIVSTEPIIPTALSAYTVVVAIDIAETTLIDMNEFCRNQTPPIKFIHASSHGVFGQCFCDFGPSFVVTDVNGENPNSAVVTYISNGYPAVVQCSQDEGIVQFGEGEYVEFKHVEGMEELNSHPPVKVLETNMYCFKIDLDTTKFGKFHQKSLNSFATAIEAKIPKEIKFRSYKECLTDMGEPMLFDFDKIGRAELLHVGFRSVDAFRIKHLRNPTISDTEEFLAIADTINKSLKEPTELNKVVLSQLCRCCGHLIMPIVSVLGGVISQEVMKAVSNKLHPINQFFYFDSAESLPEGLPDTEFAPLHTRYDSQIQVFGKSLQEKLAHLKLFVVGSGALGCELLKNFAMMGISVAADGLVTITDDDIVEKSNLSRQFLFRNYHIGKSKSQIASQAAVVMNPAFKITALQERVQEKSENIFNTPFWEKQEVVVNALDNVIARRYVDQKCVFFRKPLVESGTMGTKCNVQVVLPHKTTNYGSRFDAETKQAPECALHNFPHNINHCLSLGRSVFIDNFTDAPADTAQYLREGDYTSKIRQKIWGAGGEMTPNGLTSAKESIEPLTHIINLCEQNQVKSFKDCVVWARLQFEEFFTNRIRQLVYSFPAHATNSTGGLFWSPPKRSRRQHFTLYTDFPPQSHMRSL